MSGFHQIPSNLENDSRKFTAVDNINDTLDPLKNLIPKPNP